jgi:hypothetical protein
MATLRGPSATYHWDKTRIVWRRVDSELYLLDISTGYHFSVNHVGQEICLELDSGKTLEEVAQILHDKYETDLDVVYNDVVELVQELLRENILEERHE